MKEQGFVIYPNGELERYGTYYCPDEREYANSPKHEEDFIKEIVPSFLFQSYGYTYNNDVWIYDNALRLSLAGLLFVFNNQSKKEGPSEVLCYMPVAITEEQLTALEGEPSLQNAIMNITEFHSFDWDDYKEYSSLSEYIEDKRLKGKN